MLDILIVVVVLAILGLAVRYVVKARKSGRKCIGCPDGCCSPQNSGCSCGCGGSELK